MDLKKEYDSMSAVPKGYEGAYTDTDGKALFTGGNFDFRNKEDVLAVETAKGHVKTELAESKEKLKLFDGIDPAKQKAMLDELDILRVKVDKGENGDEDNKAILESMRARDRESDTKRITELEEQLGEANGFKTKTEKTNTLTEALKGVSEGARADAMTIIGMSVDNVDGKFLSNGTNGFEAGLELEALVTNATAQRPHWQKGQVASLAAISATNGTNGKNPFSRDSFNRTEQHKLLQSDPAMAESMKAQAEKE
jgi:hypothetical protein